MCASGVGQHLYPGSFFFFSSVCFDRGRQRIRPHIRERREGTTLSKFSQDFPALGPVVKSTHALMTALPSCSPRPKTAPNGATLYLRARSESLTRKRGLCFHFIQMLNCNMQRGGMSVFETHHQRSPRSHLSSPFCSLYLSVFQTAEWPLQ